jgi:hypothetical protein
MIENCSMLDIINSKLLHVPSTHYDYALNTGLALPTFDRKFSISPSHSIPHRLETKKYEKELLKVYSLLLVLLQGSVKR